ncbi:hypothetical protein SUGI_1123010 [Cryptomeria japonica]|nr:hypothetical protein SUGI_1123010 [Cryptomeria japonica]
MFTAGSDTSAVILEWALSLFLQHSHVMRKAQEELDSKVGRNRMVEESAIPQEKRMSWYYFVVICMVQTTLASLLQSFDWFVSDGRVIDMSEGIGLTMPRAVPLEVIIKPRLSHHLYQK